MGKSLPSATKLQELARLFSSGKLPPGLKQTKPISRNRVKSPETVKPVVGLKVERNQEETKLNNKNNTAMDNRPGGSAKNVRIPLSEVVSDCVKRWFDDTLKEAKAGDTAMQVLVAQMYFSGYGVPKDAKKGRTWISKASKIRSWVWTVGEKQPGYNASDSDSDDKNGKGK